MCVLFFAGGGNPWWRLAHPPRAAVFDEKIHFFRHFCLPRRGGVGRICLIKCRSYINSAFSRERKYFLKTKIASFYSATNEEFDNSFARAKLRINGGFWGRKIQPAWHNTFSLHLFIAEKPKKMKTRDNRVINFPAARGALRFSIPQTSSICYLGG